MTDDKGETSLFVNGRPPIDASSIEGCQWDFTTLFDVFE